MQVWHSRGVPSKSPSLANVASLGIFVTGYFPDAPRLGYVGYLTITVEGGVVAEELGGVEGAAQRGPWSY